jgi:hypothetical protein
MALIDGVIIGIAIALFGKAIPMLAGAGQRLAQLADSKEDKSSLICGPHLKTTRAIGPFSILQ